MTQPLATYFCGCNKRALHRLKDGSTACNPVVRCVGYAELKAALIAANMLIIRLTEKVTELQVEAQWIRRKLELPEDCGFVSGDPSLAGTMHVVCSAAHGYNTYIAAYRCDDKQGEIARLTVQNQELSVRQIPEGWSYCLCCGHLAPLDEESLCDVCAVPPRIPYD